MKGLKDFLPLLLLAVATRAIPLPEPRSIALVSAHSVLDHGTESASIEKREVRGDLDTTETQTELVVEEASEGEEPVESEITTLKKIEEEEATETEGVSTTEVAEEEAMDHDEKEDVKEEEGAQEEIKEEVKEEEEEEAKVEEEEEAKVEEEEEAKVEEGANEEEGETAVEVETEKPEEGAEEKEGEAEGKIGGGIPVEEEVNHENGEGIPAGGMDEVGRPLGPEEGPFFQYGHHPVEGPFPWPWEPLPLDHHPAAGIPDHEVHPVGNELLSPRKVVVPIYFIRVDPRYLHGSPYQGL
ncbi:high mobility group nucleosome-binding domain-containing protein 5-like [Hetaerina americana]|uniref:high mobility group nucleosome-binding domain-containing protein 5-like n=1 Tax=Hetaerina americana TaxID=62018 RepID=UPI003A7F5E9D